MHSNPVRPTTRRSRAIWLGTGRGRILVAVFVIGLAIAVAAPFLLIRAMLSSPPAMTASALASAAEGTTVTVAVLASGRPDHGVLSAIVLEQTDGTSYRKTGTVVQVRVATTVALAMGSPADLHTGAILQITGRFVDRQTIETSQMVILTGYVRVS